MTKKIILKNVKFFYESRRNDGVNNISCEFAPGHSYCIVGPSGSGKSTLLKILAGDLNIQAGDIQQPTEQPRKLKIFNDQTNTENRDSELTSLEYVTQHKKTKNQETLSEELLNQARDMIHFVELSDYIDLPVQQLSSGQWHRLQLVKYFLSDYDVLLLDEPFLHLDPDKRNSIAQSLFQSVKDQQKILVWSSHFLEDALSLADKILVLQYGEQQQFDTPANIFWHPQNLFTAQFFAPNNLFTATYLRDHSFTEKVFKWQDQEIYLASVQDISLQKDQHYLLMIRPSSCVLRTEECSLPATNQLNMTCEKVAFFGNFKRATCTLANTLQNWIIDQPIGQKIPTLEIGKNYDVIIPSTEIYIISKI